MELSFLPIDPGVEICQYLDLVSLLCFIACAKKTQEWALQIDALSDLNSVYFPQILSLFKKKQHAKGRKRTRPHLIGFTQLRKFSFDYWSFTSSRFHRTQTFTLLSQLCYDSLQNKTLQKVSLLSPTQKLLETFKYKYFQHFSLVTPPVSISLHEYHLTELTTNVKYLAHLEASSAFNYQLVKLTLTNIEHPQQLTWLVSCPKLVFCRLEFCPTFFQRDGNEIVSFRHPSWYEFPWRIFFVTNLRFTCLKHLQLVHSNIHPETKFHLRLLLLESLWEILQSMAPHLDSLLLSNPPRNQLQCASIHVLSQIENLTLEFGNNNDNLASLTDLLFQNKIKMLKNLKLLQLTSLCGQKSDTAIKNLLFTPFIVASLTRAISDSSLFFPCQLREICIDAGPYFVDSSNKIYRFIERAKEIHPLIKWIV